MLFFVASAYYLQKWYQNPSKYYYLGPIKYNLQKASIRSFYLPVQLIDMLKCSFFISLATLCRYEAWIIPIFLVLFVLASIIKRNAITDFGIRFKVLAILVSVLSFSGIVCGFPITVILWGSIKVFKRPVLVCSISGNRRNKSHPSVSSTC